MISNLNNAWCLATKTLCFVLHLLHNLSPFDSLLHLIHKLRPLSFLYVVLRRAAMRPAHTPHTCRPGVATRLQPLIQSPALINCICRCLFERLVISLHLEHKPRFEDAGLLQLLHFMVEV